MTYIWDTIGGFILKLQKTDNPETIQEGLNYIYRVIDEIHEIDHHKNQYISPLHFNV